MHGKMDLVSIWHGFGFPSRMCSIFADRRFCFCSGVGSRSRHPQRTSVSPFISAARRGGPGVCLPTATVLSSFIDMKKVAKDHISNFRRLPHVSYIIYHKY